MTCKNYVELIGVVGAVKNSVVGGCKVCRITLATNRAYRDSENCPVIATTWFTIRFLETNECKIPEGLQKGDKLHVEGRIDVVKYVNADGMGQTTYEIAAKRIERIDQEECLLMEE
ncbi:MAG: single-stranded DNA-binding protein [Bacteroidales bacterium]|nr:single-stranded DNA-binding protein [Bacteroidales bacterium]